MLVKMLKERYFKEDENGTSYISIQNNKTSIIQISRFKKVIHVINITPISHSLFYFEIPHPSIFTVRQGHVTNFH